MTYIRPLLLAAAIGAMSAPAATIVDSGAYRWHGDTITQGPFMATAPSATEIVSTYYAQPGYYMPVDQEWKLRNDISAYPQLKSGNTLMNAIYNMGLDEMVNAVEPDTTLRTGKEWAGVWTRDVSYSIILSMAQLQPEASRISLLKKISRDGRIIQDTGSGGAWPVSTDRMIWIVAAWEVYKATGDRDFLKQIFPVAIRSLADDRLSVMAPDGLVRGETSFIDWREQSYPRWMQPADIYQSESLSTSVVHVAALRAASHMATILHRRELAAAYAADADAIAAAVNRELWMPEKGYYAMYGYGREFPILNPRAETLGESLAVLWDVASAERADSITENNPVTPYGPAIFFPQIKDMPPYHNNALWPFVASYWALANAKAGNEEGLLEAIGSVYRPAALFATNKENFNLDNGDIATELNSSNMLWSLSGNLAITLRILFGIEPVADGLAFHPVVPRALADTRTLTGYRWRDATLDITVSGWGNRIASFRLNGKEHKPLLPVTLKGVNKVEIVMADNDFEPMKVNRTANVKAPLTPVTRLENSRLVWNPIEYIGHYVVIRDGKRIAEVTTTDFDASRPGEYQVIGVDPDGTESFASEPLSTRKALEFAPLAEVTEARSQEIAYAPKGKIEGYRGAGFVETDHANPEVTFPVTVGADGSYALSVRYANGNGPVNTENRCAVRSVLVDGRKAGTVVMPHRGTANWNAWGYTNVVEFPLTAGSHTVTLTLQPEDENMNIDTNHALVDLISLTPLD